jgi:hypothetical protein
MRKGKNRSVRKLLPFHSMVDISFMLQESPSGGAAKAYNVEYWGSVSGMDRIADDTYSAERAFESIGT